jgi:hypothetical protein
MAKVVIFDVPDFFVGKQLLEYVEIRAVDEWETVPRNCINSFSGPFTVLSIYNKKLDPQGNKILVAEIDTRHPGMIRILEKNEETIKKFKEVLKDYYGQVLILNNWL